MPKSTITYRANHHPKSKIEPVKHMNEKLAQSLGSVARTGLAFLGGFLVAKGVVTEEMAARFQQQADAALAPIITGIVTYLVAQLWSLVQKKVFNAK